MHLGGDAGAIAYQQITERIRVAIGYGNPPVTSGRRSNIQPDGLLWKEGLHVPCGAPPVRTILFTVGIRHLEFPFVAVMPDRYQRQVLAGRYRDRLSPVPQGVKLDGNHRVAEGASDCGGVRRS